MKKYIFLILGILFLISAIIGLSLILGTRYDLLESTYAHPENLSHPWLAYAGIVIISALAGFLSLSFFDLSVRALRKKKTKDIAFLILGILVFFIQLEVILFLNNQEIYKDIFFLPVMFICSLTCALEYSRTSVSSDDDKSDNSKEPINYKALLKYLAEYSRMVTEIIPKENVDRDLLFSLSRGIDSAIGRFTRSRKRYFEQIKMWEKRCAQDQEKLEDVLLVINKNQLESLEISENSMNQWISSLRKKLEIEIPDLNYLQFKNEDIAVD